MNAFNRPVTFPGERARTGQEAVVLVAVPGDPLPALCMPVSVSWQQNGVLFLVAAAVVVVVSALPAYTHT